MVSATLKYRKAGVRPPVFVGGSFSRPEWVLKEMDWVLDDRGESLFTKEIEVEEGRDFQYKFKIGHCGNNWDLDDQSPTAWDPIGNLNNLLKALPSSQIDNDPQLPPVGDTSQMLDLTSSEPVSPVNPQTAEQDEKTGDDKPELRKPTDTPNAASTGGDSDDAAVPSTPLFAHESLGAYDFGVVDDGFDHSLSPSAPRTMSSSSFRAPASDDNPNLDDPTLEVFPCDRSSVLNTLRRMSINMGDSPIELENQPSSPKVDPRRDSVDSATDGIPSSCSFSSTSSRKRESRLSYSSFDRTRSTVSLDSIVEEPPRAAVPASPRTQARDEDDDIAGSTSDDDGPSIQGRKVNTDRYVMESYNSQASSIVLPPRTGDHDPTRSNQSVGRVGWQADAESIKASRWFLATWWRSLC